MADVVTLLTTFGSLRDVASAGADELRLCPGMGESKAHRLHSLLTTPFYPPHRSRAHGCRSWSDACRRAAFPVATSVLEDEAADGADSDVQDLHSDDDIGDAELAGAEL